jgi:hypothetical protein
VITIWKKLPDESWEFVEEVDESQLVNTVASLRLNNEGEEYRAEKRIGSESIILSV